MPKRSRPLSRERAREKIAKINFRNFANFAPSQQSQRGGRVCHDPRAPCCATFTGGGHCPIPTRRRRARLHCTAPSTVKPIRSPPARIFWTGYPLQTVNIGRIVVKYQSSFEILNREFRSSLGRLRVPKVFRVRCQTRDPQIS